MCQKNAKTTMLSDDFIAPKCTGFIEILYQDDDILLINKPSGLLSLSGKNPLNWDSVHYRLVHGQIGKTEKYSEAKLPHRLDFGTSGIMVVALNNDAASALNKQFQSRGIQKRYLAMLEGWVAHERGQISAPIAKDKQLFPRVKICHATGKTAVSDYKFIQHYNHPKRSLIEYTPLTGRTHQLRIHSLEFGHPILGCDLYYSEQSKQAAKRLLLHASSLEFEHPTTGKQINGHCPCPF